jgi:hypothetical protein
LRLSLRHRGARLAVRPRPHHQCGDPAPDHDGFGSGAADYNFNAVGFALVRKDALQKANGTL